MTVDLREAWDDLLQRRRALEGSLAPYGDIVERWASWTSPCPPLTWSAEDCRRRWTRGVPLAAEARFPFTPDDLEDLLGAAMEELAAIDPARASALQRLAEAWDAATVSPSSFLPRRSAIGDGSVEAASGLETAAVAFLALATLRPALEAWLAPCRQHLADGDWQLGVCPLCGAPPGFIDVVEEGHRRLACHFCGAGWGFAKIQCPLCGVDETRQVHRLLPEGGDQGYAIVGCRHCKGFLKELDRRERWNGGPALLEDWGSPHFDLIAARAGYWRPVPTLPSLVGSH